MGASVSRTDFEWDKGEHPHITRRKEILAKYPEIKELMVVDHHFKYEVLSVVLFQFIMISLVIYFNISWLSLVMLTYIVSGTANHSLLIALHEVSHNMAFGYTKPNHNRFFSIFVNIPIGVPMALSFKKYHLDHHKHQGDELYDPDVPTSIEGRLFYTTGGKVLWLFLQPFFYALRPLLVNPKMLSKIEFFNFVFQFTVDVIIYYNFGIKPIFYMVLGSILGMGLHPLAGHFISEHYMFEKGFETYSYYGCLNKVAFNVGYHNEHHDFPNIPGSLLPKVKEIAPEYYDVIPYHTSWVKVLYDYITDPSIGPYARVKRQQYEHRLRLAKYGKLSTNNNSQNSNFKKKDLKAL